MKKLSYLLLAGILASCNTAPKNSLILVNPSELYREDAGIVITPDALASMAQEDANLLPAVKDLTGNYIPSQADDLDGDGKWDELFVLTDVGGLIEKEIQIVFLEAADYPKFDVRTNIRFAKKDENYKEMTHAVREKHATNTITQEVWQMEGIAWENDKVGFRNYFDRRNGMDIFGKVTGKMVLDEVGYKNNPSYHEFNSKWGVDVLKVGNSLGAGSIGSEIMAQEPAP
ncbi:DUF4861 family protein [Bacteroidota bacterium]